jgi:hypothetical protein
LWACHDPLGAGLPFSFLVSHSPAATFVPVKGGCGAPGGSLNLAFVEPDPEFGEYVSLRFNVPSGVVLSRVRLDRSAAGPGYLARTSDHELEREDSGERLHAILDVPATGRYVELSLSCATDPRCTAPAAGVDFRSATLTVRDTTAPSVTVSGIRSQGAFEIDVRGSDGGIGLAIATAAIDGQHVVTRAFDPSRCGDLSPFDPTKDISLTLGCAPSGRVALPVDTRNYTDGPHRLAVTVTDGAGNVRTSEQTIEIANPTPPLAATPPPAPVTVPTPASTTPIAARVSTVRELVSIPRRLTVSRRGSVSVRVLCPKDRTQTCRHRLAIAYQGREIGTGRGRSAPGRRVRVRIKLTRAAQRTVKRHSITATLLVEGARNPAAVRLKKS